MSLILVLLLIIAALAVAIRLMDARQRVGVVVLGLVALALLAPATSRLAQVTSIGELTFAADTSEDKTAAPAATEGATETAGAEEDDTSRGEPAVAPGSSVDADAHTDEKPSSQEDALTIEVDTEAGSVVIPPRPSWVESEDVRAGDVHLTAVSSGPHETERECRTYLDRELQRAVAQYIDWYLGKVYDERFQASSFVRYDLDEIKRRLVAPDKIYHEVIKVSFGPMHQMHAQLHFDQAFRRELDGRRAELDRHWREWVVSGRLWGTALGFSVVLALMGVFFGYSRLDTATRGFYTGRLQFLATIAILTVLTAGALLARQILLM